MKKKLSLLGIGAVAITGIVAAAGGAILTSQSAGKSVEVKADDPVTRIIINKDAFTEPSVAEAAGTFGSAGDTYWPKHAGYHDEDGDSFNYPFEAIGEFFRGESNEKWTGTLTLNEWTQYTQYIYFQWGGARDIDDKVYLEFVCTQIVNEGDPYVYRGTLLNNTFVDNKLMLKYFEIPAADYTKLGGAGGFKMTVNLVDGRTGDYGFNSFGYLHVNQTKEQVGDAMRYYLNHLSQDLRISQIRLRKAIQGHYFGNSYLKNVFYATAEDVDDGFESQSDFSNHWYFDHTYYNNANLERHFDTVISDNKIRPGNSQMPFNVTGDKFFRGWYETAGELNQGFINGDSARYRFISRPFVLSSTNPFVSVKMGGTASLHVIDATVNPSDTQAADLAWIDNRGYSTGGTGERIYTGFNTVTMERHVINLEAYKGRTIQLAISDISDGGWSAAYFDELKVNYAPSKFNVDVLTQATTDVGTFYSTHPDHFINSAQIDNETNPKGVKYVDGADGVADGSAQKEAYDFVTNFYGTFRVKDSFAYLNCSNFSGDLQGLHDSYTGLSSNAKAIVDASDDYTRGSDTSGNWYEKGVSTSAKLGTVVNSILVKNGLLSGDPSGAASIFGARGTSDNLITVMIVGGLSLVCIAAALAFIVKKRKQRD